MPRLWGLMLLHWATQQKCLWMCVLGKNTLTANLQDFVSQNSQQSLGFFKSLSTISQIKIKEIVKASIYSQFMSKGISILHLNKIEWLPWSLRRILETTGWCVLALWKMSNSLIPGTAFISYPSQGLGSANRCSDADLDCTGSEILSAGREHRDRKAGEEEEENKPQCSGPLWWCKQLTEHSHTAHTKHILPRTVVDLIFLAKRKTKYWCLGELKMHSEIQPPWPLGYFDI